jgi:glycerol uptake facilitator-like aquaporin
MFRVGCDPDTLSPSHLNAAVSRHGTVAIEAEERKRNKYACLSATYCFVPVAFGALGETIMNLSRDLGRRIANVTGKRHATEFLLRRISCGIQRVMQRAY